MLVLVSGFCEALRTMVRWTTMRRSIERLGASMTLLLACGDDGVPTSDGSGSASSTGVVDPSTSGTASTTVAASTASSSDDSSGTSGSSGSLDGTSTGEPALPCDVCAEPDICVIDFNEKNCIFCDDLRFPPFDVVCVPRRPEACDEALTHTRGCSLALCGTPYADPEGCGCGGGGDFNCGVNPFVPEVCDFWDFAGICGPDYKCVPARDEQLQPLPYTECIPPAVDPPAIGDPCLAGGFGEDPCEPTAYCDEVDPGTMMGTCRTLCVGDVAMPTCVGAGEACVLFAAGQPEFGGVCRPA